MAIAYEWVLLQEGTGLPEASALEALTGDPAVPEGTWFRLALNLSYPILAEGATFVTDKLRETGFAEQFTVSRDDRTLLIDAQYTFPPLWPLVLGVVRVVPATVVVGILAAIAGFILGALVTSWQFFQLKEKLQEVGETGEQIASQLQQALPMLLVVGLGLAAVYILIGPRQGKMTSSVPATVWPSLGASAGMGSFLSRREMERIGRAARKEARRVAQAAARQHAARVAAKTTKQGP